jgi:short-subunit dehydrogenase
MDNNGKPRSSRMIRKIGWGLALGIVACKVYKQLTRVSLRNKVVLITGGSRGLGLAMARILAYKGADLILCARTESQLDQARQELECFGGRVFTRVTDLRDEAQVAALFQDSITHFGRIDILINNAGVMMVGPENVMTVDDYKDVMDANLWSALYTIKAAIPIFKMQGRGHIVNICSIGSRFAVPHMLPYSVSKFALLGLSQGMSAELSRDRIKVTTVVPNLMRTGSARNITVKGDAEAEYAWFKLAASMPLLSQDADRAAQQIIDGIETGRSQIILTRTAKVVNAVQALAPGAMSFVSRLTNAFMRASDNKNYRKGWEAETALTNGAVGNISNEAANKFNEY